MVETFSLLQFFGGLFPSGAFSHSFGLENYTSDGRVKSAEDMKSFTSMYLHTVIEKMDGIFFALSYQAFSEEDYSRVKMLNSLMTAMKLTKESRAVSLRIGRALLRNARETLSKSGRELPGAFAIHDIPVNQAIASSLIAHGGNIGIEEASRAYVFSSVTSILQSGVKLIPLSATDAQAVLIDIGGEMESVARKICDADEEDISNFNPGLDIASIRHETLEPRLYGS